jgi:hypothetical protein
MPHLPIIVDWKSRIIQIDTLAETLAHNIDEDMYSGNKLAQAQALMAGLEVTFSKDLNDEEIDTAIVDLQTFLAA